MWPLEIAQLPRALMSETIVPFARGDEESVKYTFSI